MAPRTRGSRRTQTSGGGILGALATDNSGAENGGRITVKKPATKAAPKARAAPPVLQQQRDDDDASSASSESESSKDTTPPRNPRQSLAASRKNPPSAVIISKLLSPDLSIMSELSPDGSLRKTTATSMRQPLFEARTIHNDDTMERPKALFPDDDSSEDGDDELSAEQRDDNSPIATKKKRATSKHVVAITEEESRVSCSSNSEEEDDDSSASTKENEFQSDEEEQDEESIADEEEEELDDDADSENFINDSPSEEYSAEEESDYELDDSEEEEDDELEFDFDVQEEKLKNKKAAAVAAVKLSQRADSAKQKAPVSTKKKATKSFDEEEKTSFKAVKKVVEDSDDESAASPSFASHASEEKDDDGASAASSHVSALNSAMNAIDMNDDTASASTSRLSKSATKDVVVAEDTIDDDGSSSHVSAPAMKNDFSVDIDDGASAAPSFASYGSPPKSAMKNDTADEASVAPSFASHVVSEEEAAPHAEESDDDSTVLSDDNSVFSEDDDSNIAAGPDDNEVEVIAEILNDTHLGDDDDDEVVLAVVEDDDAESLEEEDARSVADSLANESFIDNGRQSSVDGSEVSGDEDDVGDTLVYDAPEEEDLLEDTDEESSYDGSETVDFGPIEPEDDSEEQVPSVKDGPAAVPNEDSVLVRDATAVEEEQVNNDTKDVSFVGSETDDVDPIEQEEEEEPRNDSEAHEEVTSLKDGSAVVSSETDAFDPIVQEEEEQRNDSEVHEEVASLKDGTAAASNDDSRDDALASNLEEGNADDTSEDGSYDGSETVVFGPIEQEEEVEEVSNVLETHHQQEVASLKEVTPPTVASHFSKTQEGKGEPEKGLISYDGDIDHGDMSDEEDGEMSLDGISFPEQETDAVGEQHETPRVDFSSALDEADAFSAATSNEASSLDVEPQIDDANFDPEMVDDIGPMIESVASKSIKEVKFAPATFTADKENQSNRKKSKGKGRKMTREGSVRKGKWALGSKIGTGSFGVVHVGMNTHTGQLMAVKSIELSPAAMKDVKSEVSMLKSLTHVNIVRYLGAERDSEKLHIFQEWVPGGSVTTLLNKFGSFSAAVMRSYLSQVLTGLAYLHDNNILHRDIKGGNVLINDEGIVKLADFGAAKRISHQQSDMMESLTMRGTPFFMAPEVFEEHYNGKADIWAVGCVAFQMATGSAPWKKEGFTNPMSLFLHLQNSEGIPLLEWPEDGSMKESEQEPFENMLKRCFWRESTRRPTAHGLIADDFFTCASSSEDDCSQSRALFSPGGDSASTFTPAKPRKTPRAQGTPPLMVRNPKTSFLSPPLPSRIIKTGTTPQVSPLMTQSPARNINAKEWPTWAREQLKQEIASPNMQRPSPKPSPLMDSLAFSTDTSDVRNPFARRSDAASSVAMSTLDGLQFLDISQK